MKKRSKLKLRKQWVILVTIMICFASLMSYTLASTKSLISIINSSTTQTDTVHQGDELTYQINLTNEKEYNSIQFTIQYDANSLEYIKSNLAYNDDGIDYDIRRSDKVSDNEIVWTFLFSDSHHNDDADLGTIKFRVKDNASGNTDIKITKMDLIKDDFNNMTVEGIHQPVEAQNKTIFVEVPVIESSITATNSLEIDLGSSNKTGQINVSYLPENTTDNKTFTYTSNDESIVTVDNNGLVTAKKVGTTNIIVTAFGKTLTVPVNVIAHINSIKLNQENATLLKTSTTSETINLIATLNPSDTTDSKTITWTSSNPAVATVDNNGLVTAIAPGTCAITAKSSNNLTAVANITVNTPAESVTIKETDFTLNFPGTKQLTKEINPTFTNATITWTSSNPSVASVDNNGLVTAVGGGTTTITLKAGNLEDSVTVTIHIPVTSINLDVKDGEEIRLYPTQSKKVIGTINPSNATIRDITYHIADTQIATVDASGNITALKPGETTLTASADNVSVTRKIKVLQNIESFAINYPNLTLNANEKETKKLSVTFTPITTDESQNITWTSNNPAIATVDNTGLVTAVGIGNAVITGTFGNNKRVVSNITVIAPIKEINITNDKIQKVGNDKTLEMIQVNSKETLNVLFNPDHTSNNKTITWTSSNPTIASVTNGVVTALNKGTTMITATSENGITDQVLITVKIPATSIKINESNLKLIKGNSKALTATINPSNTSDNTITWTSSNPSVASIASDGTLIAKNAGKTTITAKAGDKTDSIEVEVVIPITSFSLKTPNKIEILKGSSETIETIINPTDTTEDKTITWTSKNEKVAKVDEQGKITGIQNGTTIITGKLSNNMTVEVEVTVKIIPVNNMTLDIDEYNILRNEKELIKVIYDPMDTTEKDLVKWTSSDETIVTVDEFGSITGHKEGTATITGTINNLSVSATVNVSEIHLESIKVINTKNTIEVGESLELNIELNPIDTTDDLNFTYKTSDESILSIDKNGIITGKKAGTATVTITHENGIETTFQVTVNLPTNPKTLDNIKSYVTIAVVSVLTIGVMILKKHFE